MVSWPEVIMAVFLAYYWTGFEMVYFHTQLEPVDQPGYVSGSAWRRIGAGVVWPVASYANSEFAWFSICFLSSAIVLGAAYIGLNHVIGSTFLAVLVLGLLRVTPVVSALLSFPLSLLSALLWLLIAKPLGCKPPVWMERLNR